MPLIFIHGVNTRVGDLYSRNVTARNVLFRRLLLEPLAERGVPLPKAGILNPYWGDFGARARWDHASLPNVSVLEHLGSESDRDLADVAFTVTAEALAGTGRPQVPSTLEALGGSEDLLLRAARADLESFLECVMAPVIGLDEMNRGAVGTQAPEVTGEREAALLLTIAEIAADPEVRHAVATATTDAEVMALLRDQVQRRSAAIVLGEVATLDEGALEALGGGPFSDLSSFIRELFDRALTAPQRAATLPVFALVRSGLQHSVTPFLGDAFVYLSSRGDAAQPGPIVRKLLAALNRPRQRQDEPLIVVTHSMGGNIFYDILTTFAPDLEVDVWISVGTQVGLFEEVKLFLDSDLSLGAPNRVKSLGVRLGVWFNIYDPADPLAFLAAPIFEDAHDVPFLTGSGILAAHGHYFKRPSFYRALRERITPFLPVTR